MKDTSRSLCYPVYVVIVFHLVKQSARPLGFLFFIQILNISFFSVFLYSKLIVHMYNYNRHWRVYVLNFLLQFIPPVNLNSYDRYINITVSFRFPDDHMYTASLNVTSVESSIITYLKLLFACDTSGKVYDPCDLVRSMTHDLVRSMTHMIW